MKVMEEQRMLRLAEIPVPLVGDAGGLLGWSVGLCGWSVRLRGWSVRLLLVWSESLLGGMLGFLGGLKQCFLHGLCWFLDGL